MTSIYNEASAHTIVVTPAKAAGASVVSVQSRKGRGVVTLPLTREETRALIAALTAASAGGTD